MILQVKEKKLNYYQRLRERVFDELGRECVRCGFGDVRTLQIDHVNNDGADHRRKHKAGSGQYMADILRSVKANEGKYQILCANCNVIKVAEEREK